MLPERGCATRDVYAIPWELGQDAWGIKVEFEGGAFMADKVGTKAEATERMLEVLRTQTVT